MRVGRAVSEKQTIVKLTLQPGASVARVAQAEGVNVNQVFAWRRLSRKFVSHDALIRAASATPAVTAQVSD